MDYGDGTVEAICRLTAGQAFYTQAVCQSLLDHLNENKTRLITTEILREVVDGLVDNPLPQMIFLWDSLEHDEKLVLALLAESLPDDRTFAAAPVLSKLVRKREYPLELGKGRIASALANLFRAELLSQNDSTQPPGYAFRMDLWRLWIRRMHSVWQVMREVGLEIRPRHLRIGPFQIPLTGARLGRLALVGFGLAAATYLLVRAVKRSGDVQEPGSHSSAARAAFSLEAAPPSASISLDGQLAATGTFRDSLTANKDHKITVTARGYSDTTFSVRLAAGSSAKRHLELRPLLGALMVETLPKGAQILVDGVPRGHSPIPVEGLAVSSPHLVEATMPGRAKATGTYPVEPGKQTTVSLTLVPGKIDLLVWSDPPGAGVSMDGAPQGTAPFTLRGVQLRRHELSARLEGYVSADSTLDVSETTSQVRFTLAAEPPGVLVVQGDITAKKIWVEDQVVAEDRPSSGPLRRAPGSYRVKVTLVSGEDVDRSIVVKSGKRVVFDYTTGSVSYQP